MQKQHPESVSLIPLATLVLALPTTKITSVINILRAGKTILTGAKTILPTANNSQRVVKTRLAFETLIFSAAQIYLTDKFLFLPLANEVLQAGIMINRRLFMFNPL